MYKNTRRPPASDEEIDKFFEDYSVEKTVDLDEDEIKEYNELAEEFKSFKVFR